MDSRESWLESSRGKPTRVIYSWPGVDFAPYGTLELFRGPKPVSPPLSHPTIPCRHGCKHAPIKSVGGRLLQRDSSPSGPSVKQQGRASTAYPTPPTRP